jgi:hypothetical protein
MTSTGKDIARMKKGLAFLVVMVMSTSLQGKELNSASNYGDALQAARTTSRPLLVVISRDQGLPNSGGQADAGEEQVTTGLLDSYVLCQIDADTDYGKRVAKAFRVKEFPHSVIIDKTAKRILYRKTGQFTEQTWKTTLTKYQSGVAVRPVSVRVTQEQPSVQYQLQPAAQTYYRRSTFCST